MPDGLKYAFLGEDKTYPVIVSNELSPEEEERLLAVLRKHKKAIGYSLADLKGISPAFCTHRIPGKRLQAGGRQSKKVEQ